MPSRLYPEDQKKVDENISTCLRKKVERRPFKVLAFATW